MHCIESNADRDYILHVTLTIILVATIFAESMHLDAKLYLTTEGLIPFAIMSAQASSI